MLAYMCTCAYLHTFMCAHVGESVGMSVYVCGILWICGSRVFVCVCMCLCVWLCACVCVCACVHVQWGPGLWSWVPLLCS